MKDCVLILLVVAGFGALNMLGYRIGEAPGSGNWVPRDRFPRGFKIMMALNWLIFGIALFGGIACLYTSLP